MIISALIYFSSFALGLIIGLTVGIGGAVYLAMHKLKQANKLNEPEVKKPGPWKKAYEESKKWKP